MRKEDIPEALAGCDEKLLADALRQLEPEIAPDFAKFTRIETYDADMQLFR